MLNYAKIILAAINFDSSLFIKEYYKMLKWMNSEEIEQLKNWCMHTFDQNLLKAIELL